MRLSDLSEMFDSSEFRQKLLDELNPIPANEIKVSCSYGVFVSFTNIYLKLVFSGVFWSGFVGV